MNWNDARQELQDRANRKIQSDLRKSIEYWQDECRKLNDSLDVALALKSGKTKAAKITKPAKSKSESVAVMVASDWHVEEKVDRRTVNDLNEFNLSIAEKRIRAFFHNSIRLVEIQRNGTDIKTGVLAMLGDFMSGYIHDELIENNELSPTQTILWLMPRIEAGIRYVIEHGGFEKLLVVCAVGNHGRTTQKQRVATGYRNSYEWMMYHILAQRFETDKRVEFRISDGYHNLVEIYGRTIRFHHGESIRYQGGIGGLSIPAHKAISQWNKGNPAYLDVFGHWHQRIDGGSFISNGSLIGYNAFALTIKASPEPPQQTFFLLHHERGKTMVAPVWLDKISG